MLVGKGSAEMHIFILLSEKPYAMKPYSASLVNAGILIAAGTWDYLATTQLTFTSLVAFAGGFVILFLNGGLRRENRVIAHIVVVLTLLVTLALVPILVLSIRRSDGMAVLRECLIVLSGILALVYFIRSFIQARMNREK